jgi:serine/threonine-protein kinase
MQIGSRIGVYDVIAKLGEGGMGEVYRARDTKLNRDVALKVLPVLFTNDPDRLARFKREAQIVASLNHPNIAGIHGQEESNGVQALVLELVEGETLAERIARGPLSVEEALPIAKQIAEALEAAHEHGIIHRDLKPANIKLRPDGTVKVLDFGLAKTLEPASGGADVSQSPTITSPAMTQAGVILGTASYMSPEQARGKPADKRSDIWAFGCVFYEMLVGKRAFPGDDVSEVLAHVLMREPDWAMLPAGTPEPVRRLLRRCLEKNPKLRLRDAGTAIVEIHEANAVTPEREVRGRTPGSGRLVAAAVLGVVVGALFAGLGVWGLSRSQSVPDAPVRLLVGAHKGPPVASFFGPSVAISPDGRRIVYVAEAPEGRALVLYVRELDQLQARPLPNTDLTRPPLGFVSPFFSPDGQSVGVRSAGKGILRVPLDGGSPRKILDDQFISGAAWGSDDRLIIALADGLYRVSATGGGSPERLTPEPETGLFYSSPALLPGERAVVFEQVRIGTAEAGNVVAVLDLETREQRILLKDAVSPAYVPSGHLLFARGVSLMVVPFDPESLTVTGDPVPLPERVRTPLFGAQVRDFTVSRNGTLAYVTSGMSSDPTWLVWVDRRGHVVGRAVDERIDRPRAVRLSPDGRRVVTVTGEPNAGALWIYNLDGRPPLPLTKEDGSEAPVWSPDGTRVAFMSSRGGSYDVFALPADGSALEPQSLVTSGIITRPIAWLRSGDLLFFDEQIRAAPISGVGEPRQIVASQFGAYERPALSPDERWLAFVSNRTGNPEVWVQSYPDGVPTRVSRNGGDEPVWSRQGRELFYREGTRMMSVAVRTAGGRTFTFDPALALFDEPSLSGIGAVERLQAGTYDVGPDGRFLMRQQAADPQRSTPGDIVVVQNWAGELLRLAPASSRR